MSTETPKSGPVLTEATPAQEVTEVVKKPGFWSRTKQSVVAHKRPAIAVAALVGLVGVAAYVGRKTEASHDFQYTLELESASDEEGQDLESVDNTVA